MHSPIRKILAAAGTAAVIVAGGAWALASSGTPAQTTGAATSAVVHGCVNDKSRTVTIPKAGAKCPAGTFAVSWAQQGPQGPQGPAGATGATGPQGPQGPAGNSAVKSVTAATTFSNWPESSGWATDGFTRTLTVTVENQVNNSHCDGTPACYSVFGTLSDSGQFVTVDGAASPNGSSSAKITGAWQGTIAGSADFQFYASSSNISAANVPVSATGSEKSATFNTTDWGEQAFAAGTQFFGPTLTAYDWLYNATVTCGTSSSVAEQWNDGINPGDDGQGASDGNITGATACSS